MKEILLNSGFVTKVDDDDYERLIKLTWNCHKRNGISYAVAKMIGKNIKMHRLLLDLIDTPEIHVDHIDGNGLNNQRSNLRIATPQQNSFNKKVKKNSKSKYKGVWIQKDSRRIAAYISFNKKRKILGWFNTEIEAAQAYNKAATEYHGEFARLNFIDGETIKTVTKINKILGSDLQYLYSYLSNIEHFLKNNESENKQLITETSRIQRMIYNILYN